MAMRVKYRDKTLSVDEEVTKANGRRFDFDLVSFANISVALALVDGKIVMERQKRPVIGRSILELPAGKIRRGEKASAAARREFEEETGYRAARARLLFSSYMDPGIIRHVHRYFLLTGISKGRVHRDPDEQIQVLLIRPDKAISMAKSNALVDGKTITALLWARQRGII